MLEASWIGRFSNFIGIFSPRALDTAIPANRIWLCFPPEQRLPQYIKDFDGSAS